MPRILVGEIGRARGAIIRVYPYDFVDVAANGYLSVIVTIAALTAAAGTLAVGAVSLDPRLAKRYSIVPYTPTAL